MAVAPAVRHEQHDAVAGAPRPVVEPPLALPVKAHQRFDPRIAAVEIGPLVGESQMHLDDARTDRLEVDDAAVSLEMPAAPLADPVLYGGMRRRTDLPIVESAFPAGDAVGVTPPFWLAVNYHRIAADMLAVEQGRPEMTGPIRVDVVRFRTQGAAAHAHPLEVVDRLGKDRIARRANTVRCRLEALAQCDGELVVDPAMFGIPQPGIAVLSRDEDVGRA